jgi:hypothetical protein
MGARRPTFRIFDSSDLPHIRLEKPDTKTRRKRAAEGKRRLWEGFCVS